MIFNTLTHGLLSTYLPCKVLLIHLLDESIASFFHKHIDQIPTSKPLKLSQASYSENIT